MCIVEDEKGNIMTSCSTPPKEGMVIKTNTTRLYKYRRQIIRMLLSSHCRECTTCSKNGECVLQSLAKRFGIDEVRFDKSEKAWKDEYPIDRSSKSIIKNPNKCIHCGDCVRMCAEVQNVGAIDFANRGWNLEVTPAFNDPLADTDCVGCWQCVAVCPTGALNVNNQINEAWEAINDEDLRTIIQVAPAVRVALGEMFGIADADKVMPLMVAALRKLGFDNIYDTSFSADLTVMEESAEFLRKLRVVKELPLYTSCCPGCIKYAENRHPELYAADIHLQITMQMFSSVVNEERKVNKEHMTDLRKPLCGHNDLHRQKTEAPGRIHDRR